MITLIPDLPGDTLGLRASGIVTSQDYIDVIDPAIDAILKTHEVINVVYVIGPKVEHFTFHAMLQDADLAKHPRHKWGRMALISDKDWIDAALHLISVVYPMDLRHYTMDQEESGIDWACFGDH